MDEILERQDLSHLKTQVATFCQFFVSIPANAAAAAHGAISQMHALCGELARLPPSVWRAPDVKEVLGPAAELQAQSPFVRRLREWPRGYPGDFETVELLVKGCTLPTSVAPGEWIDWYVLNTAIGQQHRNKIWWQFRQMCAATPRRILSIGCGGGALPAGHRSLGSEPGGQNGWASKFAKWRNAGSVGDSIAKQLALTACGCAGRTIRISMFVR